MGLVEEVLAWWTTTAGVIVDIQGHGSLIWLVVPRSKRGRWSGGRAVGWRGDGHEQVGEWCRCRWVRTPGRIASACSESVEGPVHGIDRSSLEQIDRIGDGRMHAWLVGVSREGKDRLEMLRALRWMCRQCR